MYTQIGTFLYKIRFFIIVPLFLVADLFLLSLIPAVLHPPITQAQRSAAVAGTLAAYETPNVATASLTKTSDTATRSLISIGATSKSVLEVMGSSIVQSTQFVGNITYGVALFTGRILHTSASFIGSCVINTASFVVRAPGNVLGLVSDTASANALTRPSGGDVPVINPNYSPALIAATTAAPAPAPPSPTINSAAIWPIHGQITTEYNIPHWPYQPLHTGLDISSGNASGVIPIVPFKPGRVVEAIKSNSGLGNHVVVDHGGGLTSVYGHMHSLSVQVGQEVATSSALGYEGSTGASTGTHLHFEIRLNGQTADPRQYINGLP